MYLFFIGLTCGLYKWTRVIRLEIMEAKACDIELNYLHEREQQRPLEFLGTSWNISPIICHEPMCVSLESHHTLHLRVTSASTKYIFCK